MSLEADLLDIERKFWTGGPEAYTEHCEPECLVVFAEMATIMPRDEIAKTAERGRWTQVHQKPVGLVRLSDSSAVVAYECSAVRKDGQPYKALISSGYVRRGDAWKLATHQQTEIHAGAQAPRA